MKKIFTVMLLAVGIFFGSQFATINKASAAEVFAYSHKGLNYYVTGVENLSKEKFKVYVKGKQGNSVVANETFFYTKQPNGWFVEIHDGGAPMVGYMMSGSPTKIVYDVVKGGKWDAAIKIEQNKPQFDKFVAEGDASYNKKDYRSAIISYRQAVKLDRNTMIDYYNNLFKTGKKLYEEKNYKAALDYYQKAAVMMADEKNCIASVSSCYNKLKDYEGESTFFCTSLV